MSNIRPSALANKVAPMLVRVFAQLGLVRDDAELRERGNAMIEAADGDYVLKNSSNNVVLRVQIMDGLMSIHARSQLAIIASISEARELRDWITRQLDEPFA